MHTEPGSLNAQRVVVGMSGGVDSAVAAALLLEAGFEVHAVTFLLWQSTEAPEGIAASARAIAEALGIPLLILDLRERFFAEVVTPWMNDYANGLTPNPCVSCNPDLKFAALLEAAEQLEAQWIATGHYARVSRNHEGLMRLQQARNRERDQSYMLYRLSQPQLARLKLPLGDLADKAEVRAHATHWGLPNAHQADSQDLCFLGGGDYRTLLQRIHPNSLLPGPILDQQGNGLGQHTGLPNYTIGQRSGLGLALGVPQYVLELRPQDNALIVGTAEALLRQNCWLENLNFIGGFPPAPQFEAEVRIRYRASRIPASIEMVAPNQARITFTTPQRSVAPGQSVVFYEEDCVLGGGIISLQR
ncbi:MAG: tRNA 2-thiouridine(34) synthase MnmA [Anaerolineae bacterium]|nr:tRNA 2-thiouridine(34) synthase MnmA [Anaerolineae bacterium]